MKKLLTILVIFLNLSVFGQITISQIGNSIKFTEASIDKYYPKEDLSVGAKRRDATTVQLFLNGIMVQEFVYTAVTSPTSTGGNHLAARIDTMIRNISATIIGDIIGEISGNITATLDSNDQRSVISIDNFPATQPVSGTVNIVSTETDTIVTKPIGTQAVSGTFWQATQAVSGTFFQTTQPVSGTFWPATQPVSLSSTTITGTVAATQSGTWTVQPGNTANTTAWKVDGSAVTQPISGSVTTISQSGTLTDGSGSITTGGASQTIFLSSASRKYLLIQNISDINLYVNFGASATVDNNSIKLIANGFVTFDANFIPTQSITIIGATTGKKFIAKQN